MSFILIPHPKKRDEIVKSFLATRKRIQQRNIQDKLGDMAQSEDRQKMFGPIIQSNLKAADEIAQELVPIRKELEEITNIFENQLAQPALPPIPQTPQRRRSLPSIPTPLKLGLTAIDHLRQALSNKSKHDGIFGIYNENKDFKIGSKVIHINGNDIEVAGKHYQGTEGLWALLTKKDPKNFSDIDLYHYKKILFDTNALYQNNDPTADRPKSSRSSKWHDLLKPMWNELKGKSRTLRPSKLEDAFANLKPYAGKGVVYLSEDPCELVSRLNLLISEYRAGNSTTRNEIIAITDLLKQKAIIDNDQYKALNASLF